MANEKFLPAVAREGYCCPWSFFKQNNRLSALELGNKLDVSRRTAVTWRRLYRTKQLQCKGMYWCFKAGRIRNLVSSFPRAS